MQFKYVDWSFDHGWMWKEHTVGKKCVGLQHKGRRPVAVEFTHSDLTYLHKNPDYLTHFLSVLREYEIEE